MKSRLLLIAFLLTCLITGWGPLDSVARAAASGVTGRYTVAGTPGAYVDLRPDGTFTFHLPDIAFSGTYTAKGTEVTISIAGQKPEVINVENGILTDTDGNKWTRSGDAVAAQPAPGATPPAPPPAKPAATESANVKFNLTMTNNGKGRTGAMFPAAQMPADRKGYVWVTERPNNQTTVAPLQRNTWFVYTVPGVYKVHVEFRGDGANQTVSNVLEITIPPILIPRGATEFTAAGDGGDGNRLPPASKVTENRSNDFVGPIDIHDFYMTVRKIVPEDDSKASSYMAIQFAPGFIGRSIVGISRRKVPDRCKAFYQKLSISLPQPAGEFEDK